MTLQFRTLDQILADLKNYFLTNSPFTLVQEGTVPNDIINAVSIEADDFYAIQAFVQNTKTIAGLRILISNSPDAVALFTALQSAMGLTATQVQGLLNLSVDEFATNYGVTRLAATFATVTLRFLTTSNANVSIPINTIATTASLTSIQYATTIVIVNQPVTLDPATGLYYIDVPAQSVVPGTASTVPQNRLTVLSPMLAGFAGVTNPTPSSGGTDTESNSSVLDRCTLSLKGRELDTISGLTLFTKSQVGVLDASVIDNSSPFMTRGVGDQVDIRVLGSNIQPAQDTVTWNNAIQVLPPGFPVSALVLNNQPVSAITSVLKNTVPLTPGVDYTLVKDTGGFSGSVKGMDLVSFSVGAAPTTGDVIVVNYTYDQLMGTLQILLGQNPNKIPNSDILFREAEELFIDITMHVVVFAGFNQTQVQSNVTTALTAYFNALLMGAPPKGLIPQSDIASISAQVAGVSFLDISNLSINPAIGLADIPVNPIQFARLNTLTFV